MMNSRLGAERDQTIVPNLKLNLRFISASENELAATIPLSTNEGRCYLSVQEIKGTKELYPLLCNLSSERPRGNQHIA